MQAQGQIFNVKYVTSPLPINATWIGTKMRHMPGVISSARSVQQLMLDTKSCRNTLKMGSTWWSSIVKFVIKSLFSKTCKLWKSMSRSRMVVDAKVMGLKFGVHHHQETGMFMEAKVCKKKKSNSSEGDWRRPKMINSWHAFSKKTQEYYFWYEEYIEYIE